jgi:hypothetical protein
MSDTKVNFTLDDVVAKVREVAAERPTYVYDNGTGGELSSCFYRHGADRSEPGCIVGQALDRLGYVVPELWEGTNASSLLQSIFPEVDRVDSRIFWVRSVQSAQDGGMSWADAVAEGGHRATLARA